MGLTSQSLLTVGVQEGLWADAWGWGSDQCARVASPLSATVSALGSCSPAGGWGGALRRGPAGEKEAEVRTFPSREHRGSRPTAFSQARIKRSLCGTVGDGWGKVFTL